MDLLIDFEFNVKSICMYGWEEESEWRASERVDEARVVGVASCESNAANMWNQYFIWSQLKNPEEFGKWI